eukprot:s7594_g6.t1
MEERLRPTPSRWNITRSSDQVSQKRLASGADHESSKALIEEYCRTTLMHPWPTTFWNTQSYSRRIGLLMKSTGTGLASLALGCGASTSHFLASGQQVAGAIDGCAGIGHMPNAEHSGTGLPRGNKAFLACLVSGLIRNYLIVP